MIDVTPQEWATARRLRAQPVSTPWYSWIVRHGLWILLLLIVTAWEVLGVFFPEARKVPEWFDHPTISQEMKAIIGTSLAGRVIASAVIAALGVLLTLHWAWRVV